jgi:F0F1-type ATP synthase assembly protein I
MKSQSTKTNNDKSSWVIGGTTVIGLGVGFIFLQTSVWLFLASLFIGIGAGLVIAPLISKRNNQN